MSNSGGSNASSGSPAVLLRRQFDWDETPPSVAVVLALSDLSPPALDRGSGPTLSQYVDPDALDAMVTHGPAAPSSVSVSIDGYRVTIEGQELRVTG